jgi:pimeloyl-ACP methyl ester carboxylesterase
MAAERTAPRAANAAMRAGRFTDLAAVEVPVTLVWPRHDRLVGRPRRLPAGVRERLLPDAGHVPMWDDPGGVAAALLDGSAVTTTACRRLPKN